MATYDCPHSLVAQFSDSVFRSFGASAVLSHLLEAIDPSHLHGVQFLRGGRVGLFFKDVEEADALFHRDLVCCGESVILHRVDRRICHVYLKDLPLEFSNDAITEFFESFGEVSLVHNLTHPGYPNLSNGNRLIDIILTSDVPPVVTINGWECRVWYKGQPRPCPICKESGHLAPACPLSGLCRHCKQPGHVARECRQAWGPPPSVSSTLVSVQFPSEDNSPDFVPAPVDVPRESSSEGEIMSGDEQVVALAVDPEPPTVSKVSSGRPVTRASVSGSSSSPASVPLPASQSQVHLPVDPDLHKSAFDYARKKFTVMSSSDLAKQSAKDDLIRAKSFAARLNRSNDSVLIKYVAGVFLSVRLQVAAERSPTSEDETTSKRLKT